MSDDEKTRITNNGSENILRDIVSDGTIKIYNGFDGSVTVGAQGLGVTHKEYADFGPFITLDNGKD